MRQFGGLAGSRDGLARVARIDAEQPLARLTQDFLSAYGKWRSAESAAFAALDRQAAAPSRKTDSDAENAAACADQAANDLLQRAVLASSSKRTTGKTQELSAALALAADELRESGGVCTDTVTLIEALFEQLASAAAA